MAGYFAKPPHGSRLNPADRLGKGLVSAWLETDKAGPTVRDAAGGRAGNATMAGTPGWVSSPYGPALQFTATSQTVTGPANPLTGSSVFSVGAILQANRTGFASNPGSNCQAGGDGWALGCNGDSTSLWTFSKSVGFGSGTAASDVGVTTDFTVLLGTVSVVGTVTLYVNGVPQATTGTKTGTITNTNVVTVFTGVDFATLGSAGVWLWKDRCLSASAARAWSADPFRMFRPRRLPVPLFSPVVGTTVTWRLKPNPQSPTVWELRP